MCVPGSRPASVGARSRAEAPYPVARRHSARVETREVPGRVEAPEVARDGRVGLVDDDARVPVARALGTGSPSISMPGSPGPRDVRRAARVPEVERARRFDLEQRRRVPHVDGISIHKCDARRTFYDPGVPGGSLCACRAAPVPSTPPGPAAAAATRRRSRSRAADLVIRRSPRPRARSPRPTEVRVTRFIALHKRSRPGARRGPTRAREAVARRRRQAQRARMQRAAQRQRLALLRRQRRRRDAHGREARARRRSSTTPDPPRRERHEAPQHGDGQPFGSYFYRYRSWYL